MLVFETVTIGLSPSEVDEPACGDYHAADEWFSFTAPVEGDVAIQLLEASITNAAFALYSGSCNNLEEIECVSDYLCGTDPMPAWFFENLTPGATYYLRIWNEDGPVPGNVQIRISHPSGNPYETTGSATNISFEGYSNCIQLTAAITGQAGCAWYPVQVDFSQAFEHNFNLYFGTIQGQAGADGMAIIYQINGIPTCGVSGAGIGYQGIGNSWAIEFDTYQNGPPYIDPVEDHTAISINGDLSFHPSGPVTLGYISDDEFHDVVVNWEPATQRFRVWFDGDLVHDLIYDIVNQVFGGQTMVWWGVSASTGGAVNQHVLCFDDVEIENLVNVYVEVEMTVCENELVFLGGGMQTEPGTYIDYFTAFNGCDSIVTTELSHFPSSDPVIQQEVICPGEVYFFHGIPISEEGLYEVFLTDQYGCDSLVILEASIPYFEAYLEEDGPLDCEKTLVTAEAVIESDADEIFINWVTFGGNIVSGNGTRVIELDQPGIYVATIFFEKNGKLCGPYQYEIVVNEFQFFPFGEIAIIGALGCNDETVILDGSNIQNADEYNWVDGPGGIIGYPNSWSVEVNTAGIYQLEVVNFFSGCTSIIEVEVDPPPGAPVVIISLTDTAFCGNPLSIVSASGSSDGEHILYTWSVANGEIIGDSSGSDIEISGGDLVSLIVLDTSNNCQSSASLQIPFDDTFPNFSIFVSGELNCETNAVELEVESSEVFDGELFYNWIFEAELIQTDTGVTTLNTTESGWYILEIFDITRNCVFLDSIEVFSNYDQPFAELLHPGDIDCLTDILVLDASGSGPDSLIDFMWYSIEGEFIAEPVGSFASITEPGIYFVEVMHQLSRCIAVDTIVVRDLREVPEWNMPNFFALNCRDSLLAVDPEIIFPVDGEGLRFDWYQNGDDEPFSNEKIQFFSEPGSYFLVIRNESNYCEAVQELIIDANKASPNLLIEGPEILNCANESGWLLVDDLSTAGQIDYKWFNALGNELPTDNPAELTVSSPGWYFVLAENLESYCSSLDSIYVSANFTVPVGELYVEPGLINCINTSVELIFEPEWLNDSLVLNWTMPDGQVVIQEGTPFVQPLVQGGWVSLEVIHPVSLCIYNTEIRVDTFLNQPQLDLNLSSTTLSCRNEEINGNFKVSGLPEHLKVTLNGPMGEEIHFFSDEGEFQILIPGEYKLWVVDTLSLCEDVLLFEITEDRNFPLVEFLPFDHLNCNNEHEILGIESGFEDEGVFSIEWYRNNELLENENNSTLSADSPGEYTIVVENLLNGCRNLAKLELLFIGTPISSVLLSFREVDCKGINGAIFIKEIAGGSSPIELFVNGLLSNFKDSLTQLGPGTYNLEWIDDLGCRFSEDVLLREPLDLEVSIPPLYQINEGQSVELEPIVNKERSVLLSIEWDPGDFLDCINCLFPISSPDYSIDYQLKILDNIGCEQIVNTRVEVKINRDLYIPNAFSPGNRDGINDYFYPLSRKGRIFQIKTFEVFDRWGEKVFSALNMPPDQTESGWDGTFSGEILNPGVFLYLFEIEWMDGEITLHRGDVSLLK